MTLAKKLKRLLYTVTILFTFYRFKEGANIKLHINKHFLFRAAAFNVYSMTALFFGAKRLATIIAVTPATSLPTIIGNIISCATPAVNPK